MEVFISWSGKRSFALARLLQDFISRVVHPIKPWMSDDILPGRKWSNEISNRLIMTDLGILCITPENQEAVWLLFEAGALYRKKDNSIICPVLLGLKPSDLKGPLALFQAIEVNENDMLKLTIMLNDKLGKIKRSENILKEEFHSHWLAFKVSLDKEIQEISLETSSVSLANVLDVLTRNGLPTPQFGRVINFSEGFECHALYDAVFKSAKKRILIFGRKNRKIFDKEYNWFFIDLNKRMVEGFEFKCLFLDPNANKFVIESAHEDIDFIDHLNNNINQAKDVASKFGFPILNVFKKYSFQRYFSIVIVDDAVLFTPIETSCEGKAKRLTKVSFTLASIETCQGQVMMNNFLSAWQSSIDLNIKTK